MGVRTIELIFSEDKREQFRKALNASLLAHRIKVDKTAPIKIVGTSQNGLSIKILIDDSIISKLFTLGVEFEKVGKIQEVTEIHKEVFCCDKCRTLRKFKKGSAHKFPHVKNYCDTCYEEIHLLHNLDLAHRRKKQVYLRKMNSNGREPPQYIPQETKSAPEQIKAPTIKIKFTT